ncbi:MAG: SCP2 sterol-binding domain-containing protein [Bdellovibrio sp.]|nr:SCP2 sterol-binding domain-containing protein [Bdellovibrio sp.]
MADAKEVLEALQEYTRLSNSNARLKKMNKDWSKTIEFHANDLNLDFLMKVEAGVILETRQGKSDSPPDIIITSTSEVFCDMFWGDLNPTQKYLTGELQVKGSQEDIMRLDAISAVIWPE